MYKIPKTIISEIIPKKHEISRISVFSYFELPNVKIVDEKTYVRNFARKKKHTTFLDSQRIC